ncbi:MAG: hypothetical protein WAO02_04375 [Verrucomicrobiia bacterium]
MDWHGRPVVAIDFGDDRTIRVVAGGGGRPTVDTFEQAAFGGVATMLLLSDGTVMAQQVASGTNFTRNWFKLTPDSSGSYVNGDWTNRAPMNYTRLFYSSVLLRDGRVFVAGAEYGTGWNTAEVYSPDNDTWTIIPVPAGLVTQNNTVNSTNAVNSAGFMDSGCVLLPDGRVLISPVNPGTAGGTVIFDPNSNTCSAGPAFVNGDSSSDEQSWVKLPDDSILTFDSSLSSQRYIPSLNQWIPDKNLPVQLYDAFGGEIGAGFLLPNGRAFYLGANGNTVLYTPSGNTSFGNWTIGPPILNAQATPDAAAAMMANGRILCAVSPVPTSKNNLFTTPTSFYEYDYSSGSTGAFVRVDSPRGNFTNAGPSFITRMLDLPDGTVLFADGGSQLYEYQPGGSPLPAGKPAIGSVTWNGNGSLHLTGTLFNGISQGAAYGDDAQMDSNYPLIRFTDGSGNVSYGHTVYWSRTGVQTGNQLVTTECALSSAVAYGPGAYTMQVVANGIASDPVGLSGPVWVDFNFGGSPQNGTYSNPYHLLAQGTNVVAAGAEIFLKPGLSHETMTITKPMTIVAIGGWAIIGQ